MIDNHLLEIITKLSDERIKKNMLPHISALEVACKMGVSISEVMDKIVWLVVQNKVSFGRTLNGFWIKLNKL